MRKVTIVFLSLFFSICIHAQLVTNGFAFTQTNDIKVVKGGDSLVNAWAGGINFAQFNTYDFDNDGLEDLLVFERNGSRILPFLNTGTYPDGDIIYVYAPEYKDFFPVGNDFYLLKDYNCDGKKDVFLGAGSGVAVYENISSGNNIAFRKAHTGTNIAPLPTSTVTSITVPSTDIPGIVDINGDGAVDILTFRDTHVDWIENQTPCGLDFVYRDRCWGGFVEGNFDSRIYLNICSEIIKGESEDTAAIKEKVKHAGSTILPLDLTNNGLMDLLIADISSPGVHAVYNTGTPDSAFMSSKDSIFPSYDTPIDIPEFPAMFYEDVTGDGHRDLLVSPNQNATMVSASVNHNNLWMYENTGTDSTPVFNLRSRNFLRNTQIDIGEGCVPRFADLNGDGLQDLVLANNFYKLELNEEITVLMYLENIGNTGSPVFEVRDTNYLNISSYGLGRGLIPTFGDLDQDGDLDMIIGDENGKMHLFTNTGSQTNAQFTLTTPGIINGADVGGNAAPFLFDMDRDDDLDLIVGKTSGKLSYFENQSASQAEFIERSNFFGGVDVSTGSCPGSGHFSIPYVFEADSIINLIVGSACGGVRQYDSISSIVETNVVYGQVGHDTLETANSEEGIFGATKKSSRNQMLFRAEELKAAGLSYGLITGMTFNILTNNNLTIQRKMFIQMKNVSYDAIGNDFDEQGLEFVRNSERPFEVGDNGNSGPFYIEFDIPFLWDGKSNLLIQMCYSNTTQGNLAKVEMSNTSFKSHAYGDISQMENADDFCGMPFLNAIHKRPNIEFELIPSFDQTLTHFNNGYRTAPAIADIDKDGYIDAVVGNYGGGLYLYRGEKFNVGLPENEVVKREQLKVYPNPGKGLFTVSTENMSSGNIDIFDLTGRRIKEVQIEERETTIDISRQPVGIYLFILRNGNVIRSQKVVME